MESLVVFGLLGGKILRRLFTQLPCPLTELRGRFDGDVFVLLLFALTVGTLDGVVVDLRFESCAVIVITVDRAVLVGGSVGC